MFMNTRGICVYSYNGIASGSVANGIASGSVAAA